MPIISVKNNENNRWIGEVQTKKNDKDRKEEKGHKLFWNGES